MSTSKDEVQAEEEYMTKYYPPVDQMYNKGGLTLVSKSFLKWANNLIIEINRNINLNMIWKKKNDIMKEAVKCITNNKSLLQLFREALPIISTTNEGVIRKCETEVILKVIHARAGTIFHIFIERFIGHYSNKINVEFRKNLQVTEKNKQNKAKVEK